MARWSFPDMWLHRRNHFHFFDQIRNGSVPDDGQACWSLAWSGSVNTGILLAAFTALAAFELGLRYCVGRSGLSCPPWTKCWLLQACKSLCHDRAAAHVELRRKASTEYVHVQRGSCFCRCCVPASQSVSLKLDHFAAHDSAPPLVEPLQYDHRVCPLVCSSSCTLRNDGILGAVAF